MSKLSFKLILFSLFLIFKGNTGEASNPLEESPQSSFVTGFSENSLSYCEDSSEEWKNFIQKIVNEERFSKNSAEELLKFMENGEKAAFLTIEEAIKENPRKMEKFCQLLKDILYSHSKGSFLAASRLGTFYLNLKDIKKSFHYFSIAENKYVSQYSLNQDTDFLFNYASTLFCFNGSFPEGCEKALDKAWTYLKIWEEKGVREDEKEIFEKAYRGFFKAALEIKATDLSTIARVYQEEERKTLNKQKNIKKVEKKLNRSETNEIILNAFYIVNNYTEVLHILYQNFDISTVCLKLDNLSKNPFFSIEKLIERDEKNQKLIEELIHRNIQEAITHTKKSINSTKHALLFQRALKKLSFEKNSQNLKEYAYYLILNVETRKILLKVNFSDDLVFMKRLQWISNFELEPIVSRILLQQKNSLTF